MAPEQKQQEEEKSELYLRLSSEISSEEEGIPDYSYGDLEGYISEELDSLISTIPSQTLTGDAADSKHEKSIEQQHRQSNWWTRNWLPESPWYIYRTEIQILDAQSVKLFKFFATTILAILFVHYYAILVNADRDETYTLKAMVLFDGNHIVLDIVVFFVVGRLYEQASIDSLAWMVPAILSAVAVSSAASLLPALHHSITPYEIHCSWGWQMWALVLLLVLPLIVGFVGGHFVHAFRNGFGVRKLIELGLGLTIFLAPYASNASFHLHHWYYAWVLGMHANLNVWWSRLFMSVLWGIYINGIAIFGRDPIMTCAVTLYQSENQECPYVMAPEDYTMEVLSSSTTPDWETMCNLELSP